MRPQSLIALALVAVALQATGTARGDERSRSPRSSRQIVLAPSGGDDTAAIQAALDAGEGRPVTVYLSAGTYKVAPREPPSGTDLSVGHALYINYDNVRVLGAGRRRTTIRAFVRGMRDPVTSWDVSPKVGVWRGSTFFVRKPKDGATRRNVEIGDLRITGQTPRSSSAYAALTALAPFPPRRDTGDGWGGYHSAIMFAVGMSADGFRVHDCELDSYRAEIVISQGAAYAQKDFRFERCYVHDSLGNGLNAAASQVITGCEITRCGHAVELYHYQANVTIERNYIHDNVRSISDGGNISIGNAPYGLLLIRNNRFARHPSGGIFVLGHTSRVEIVGNQFTDDGYLGYGAILTGTLYGASPSDVSIHGNTFVSDRLRVNSGVNVNSDAGHPTSRIRVRDNVWRRTPYARAHGLDFGASLSANLYNAADDVVFEANDTSRVKPQPGRRTFF